MSQDRAGLGPSVAKTASLQQTELHHILERVNAENRFKGVNHAGSDIKEVLFCKASMHTIHCAVHHKAFQQGHKHK